MRKSDLVDLSDTVWERIRARVEGLSDDEYFWEPAPGCWTIRQRRDGSWVADWPLPRPDPEPFTTIAWRMWHLIDMYGEDRAPRWLDVPPQGPAVGFDALDRQPPTNARDAIALLERAHDRWDAHLAVVSEASLDELVGAVGGPHFAERTRTAYVLHMLDEYIHHGAEVGLLRDLWRWQHSIDVDPRRELVARGDASVLEGDAAFTAELVDHAAAYGRWDLLAELVRRGAPISTTGRTPLHMAAAAGDSELVKLLLEHGADRTARDPEFHATPREWAEFLHYDAVAELLDVNAM